MHYIDEAILEGILLRDNDVINYIYKVYYPSIKYFIISNSGHEEDVEDIFQDSLIIIYKKLKNKDLQLVNCSFKTFLYSVCRNLWLKELEKRKNRKENVIEDTEEFIDVNGGISTVQEENEKFKLYQLHFSRLSEDCQKVLRLFLDKVPLREIARIMGYGSEKYAKKRKYQCKETLIKKIKSDTNFQQI